MTARSIASVLASEVRCRATYCKSRACITQAFVGYCDIQDEVRFHILDFVDNPDTFHEFLVPISANGGGDACEDVAGGLQVRCHTMFPCA